VKPEITIAIPFHNEVDMLAGAIRCVFAQTVSDWELLLVDDGSTDGSRELALSVRDPRVSVLGSADQQGISRRLNEITRVARADVIARMDADDAVHPQRIERELSLLRQRPELSAVRRLCERRWHRRHQRGETTARASRRAHA
jgi:glycosyltransferase involved in cell wall biosynthesis